MENSFRFFCASGACLETLLRPNGSSAIQICFFIRFLQTGPLNSSFFHFHLLLCFRLSLQSIRLVKRTNWEKREPWGSVSTASNTFYLLKEARSLNWQTVRYACWTVRSLTSKRLLCLFRLASRYPLSLHMKQNAGFSLISSQSKRGLLDNIFLTPRSISSTVCDGAFVGFTES